MTKRLQSDIDSLSAPASNGDILIRPGGRDLVRMAEDNRRRRDGLDFPLLDRPASEWFAPDAEAGLVFMSGHQPDFFHAGVWAKSVMTSILAERTGGAARFLVVDSDVPDRIAIQWPDDRGEYCRMRKASATSSINRRSFEHLSDRDSLDYGAMFAAIPAGVRSDATPMPAFEAGFMHPSAGASGVDYVDRWASGIRGVERELGVRSPTFRRISDIFSHDENSSDEFAPAFVAHLILHAKEFVAEYNRALADYRTRRGIRGRQHPIPDLVVTEELAEMPFWALHATKPRQRLSVSIENSDRVGLWAGENRICTLARDELRKSPASTLQTCLDQWQIRPRALTQTMYARLFACDLFIHGIGGAKYDQITDEIIRGFFGIEPPAYACVSATLWLPLKRFDISESDLRAGRRRARDLRYNPQRYLANGKRTSEVRTIIERREQAIDESERLRKEQSQDRRARRAAYDRIHQANADLINAVPEMAEETNRRNDEISTRLDHNRIAKSREWFFALHPKARLIQLRDRLKDEADD